MNVAILSDYHFLDSSLSIINILKYSMYTVIRM